MPSTCTVLLHCMPLVIAAADDLLPVQDTVLTTLSPHIKYLRYEQ